MLYLISIIPIILYLVFIKTMDAIALAKWSRMAECFIWGILSCYLAFMSGERLQNNMVAPLFEELIKCLPFVIAIYRGRSAFFAEALIYGAAVGAGFALLENILYIYYNAQFTLGDALIRGFGTALLHMGCSALFASVTIVGTRWAKNKSLTIKCIVGALAIVPSWFVHFMHNTALAEAVLPEFLIMIINVIVMFALFLAIYDLDEKLIHKWLDLCIANDIALYTSVKEGKLKETNAGQYLIATREKFKPEVFFDILVYLELYLEISIAAKSRMIMKEAGFDMEASNEEHLANSKKIAELKNLANVIGKAGQQILSPIVNVKATDDWVMKELL